MTTTKFRTDIEGLRAVAILLVVGCHCAIPGFGGGFIGVDVFFVLSGYLITGMIAQEARDNSRIDLAAFYARRARRLLPACAVVIIATTLAAAALYPPDRMTHLAGAARAAGLYFSNIYFDFSASDYFAPSAATNPLLHTWSLGVEEQFYLFWPVLLAIATGKSRRWATVRWTLLAVATASLTCSILATHAYPSFAFYELPARGWEFAAGGLLALTEAGLPRRAGSSGAILCGLAGLALIVCSAVSLSGGAEFPGWRALLPVAGTVAILFSGSRHADRGIGILLSAPPLQVIGARSYSWYLWHWPALVFAGVVAPDLTLSGRIGVAVGSYALAEVTYRLVERPIRESPSLRVSTAWSLRGALGLSAAIVAAAWSLTAYAQRQDLIDGSYRMISNASTDMGDLPRECWSYGNSFAVRTCEFGSVQASRTLVLFGDSHAMQWFNAVRGAAEAENWRLLTFVRPSCAARDLNPEDSSIGVEHCREWRAEAVSQMLRSHPAAIILASFNAATVNDRRVGTAEIGIATHRTLARLASAGIPLIILRDTPEPPTNIPMCINHYYPNVGRCAFDAKVAMNAGAYDAERSAAVGFANVHFIDFTDILCPGSTCPVLLRGHVAYRDESHMAGEAARALIPEMRARLVAVLSGG